MRSAGLERAAGLDYANVARQVHDVLVAVTGGRAA
jgi:hypothetical protein